MTDAQGRLREHLSAFTLDRRALGDLSEAEAQAMDLHLAECAPCRGRLTAQQENFQSFEQYVLPALLPTIRAGRQPGPAWRFIWAIPIVASLALAILVLPHGARRGVIASDVVATKGGPTFQTFVRRATQVFAASDGMRLLPGDALRFVVQPGELRYLLIVSRDGAGVMTVYYPFRGTESAELKSEGRNELPGSIELDATPGEERLFALFSKQPLQAATVISTLSDAAADPSAADVGADSLLRLTFVKGTP